MQENGFQNLLYFMGVVEDRNDPRKLGRVRVRAFDIHPDDKNLVPTEALPWALPIVGTHNNNYKPPLEGSWVFGFFIDGQAAQHPIIFGNLLGMPTSFPYPTQGFNSSRDLNPHPNEIYKPDIPSVARGEDIQNTNVLRKWVNREDSDEYPWKEPKPFYNATYPHNDAKVTESGHLLEMDDTPGSERINIEHKTGTFFEIGPNGTQVNKIVGDDVTIVEKNGRIMIKGNSSIIIQGSHTLHIESDCELQVDGSLSANVHGDFNMNVAGEFNMNAGGAVKLRGSSIRQESYLDSINIFAKKNFHTQAQGNVIIQSNLSSIMISGNTGVNLQSLGGNISEYAGQNINKYADGAFQLETGSGNIDLLAEGKFRVETHSNTDFFSTKNIRMHSGSTGAFVNNSLIVGELSGGYISSQNVKPSLRTLLGEPISLKFSNLLDIEEEPYTSFIDDEVSTDSSEV